MPIQSGTRLGPYEILSAIGAGGMGEVYRARDPKLGRDVAIKVLPEAFARDLERMARFQREAKVLASLDHPNIASIYGLEDSGGTRGLVMQLVEGPTLADRVRQGPIPVDESVRIARQIADALEYAHERGIIHRDLKPANVKVTSEDAVKVLDFGLAKALEGDPSSIDISTSPTITQMATQQGVLLGTAAYMSPEQAKAKPVDRRADIWAFGCVLYEMLTRRKVFTGETVTDTLASVIKEEPDWKALPAATPMRVRVLLQRCLQKDPRERLQAIGDARITLNEVLSGAPDLAPVARSQVVAPFWRRALPWAVTALTLVTLAPVAFVHFREKPSALASALPVQRFEIAAPDVNVNSPGPLSPDGKSLVLSSQILSAPSGFSKLWLRRMDSLDAHPIEGTEGANGVPFWSPDSRFIVFGTADGKLKKIDTEGGPAQVLCDSGGIVAGGFYSPDGNIVFSSPAHQPGIWEVPAGGGVPSPLRGIEHTGNPNLFFPVLLPDGRHFLYTNGREATGDVYLGSLDDKSGQHNQKKLVTGIVPAGAVYAPSADSPDRGYLVFEQGNPLAATLLARPFDVRKLEFAGEAVPIAEQVSTNAWVSLTGILVYGSSSAFATSQLSLFNRQGKLLETVAESQEYGNVAFAPDGQRVVADRSTSGRRSLWVMDLTRGTSSKFTFDSGDDVLPVWSPDGNRIAFASTRLGDYHVFQKLSNGGGEDELVFKSDQGAEVPLSWSSDGHFLILGVEPADSEANLVLPLDKDVHATGKPFLFASKGTGIDLKFSPGPQGQPRWVAYTSRESGRYEIYVRPFDPNSPTGTPPGGGKWQVSTNGGVGPHWSGDGKELFYVALDGTVMSVAVSGDAAFQSGIPKPLFKPKGFTPVPSLRNWDASSDGKKFIFVVSQSASAAAPPKFTVVLNWPSLLRK